MNNTRIGKPEGAPSGPSKFAGIALIMAAVLLTPFYRSYSQEESELRALKEQIKREILEELRGGAVPRSTHSEEIERLKQEIKEEILRDLKLEAETFAQPSPEPGLDSGEEAHDAVPEDILREVRSPQLTPLQEALEFVPKGVGHAEGQILRRGAGLGNCKVKLLRLSGVSTRYRGFDEGVEFETVTSADGGYRFENIPPGNYKLKWQPPGENGWIRRLWDKPDATIRPGQIDVLKPVETARRLAPR